VTAITGSNGKTTTRQMTASVVSQRFDTLSTKKNFNNNIGLPLTLLELCPKHRWAVVELGMNAPGEIDLLARICKPDIGVITNVGPAHLEGVGTIEGVMRAKGELLGRIRSGGTAVLNFDDERVRRLGEQAACRVMFYGLSASAAVRAEALEAVDGGTRFTLRLPDGTGERVLLNLPGQFMVVNALAAAAVGCLVGLSPSDIRAGLEHFEPVAGRMNISIIGTGIHLIDDTYNANPASMAAALTTLAALRKDRRSFAVLGDMRELGDHADALHRELGVIAAESGLQVLFVCGEFAEAVARGALEAGMAPDKVIAGDKAHLLKCLIERLKPDDWVLVKGSRAMAMEETVSGLRAWAKTLS
jgi:UDP-N-acetylmuramoyl-tripeptide--D-alanyl-D-alanine ligase